VGGELEESSRFHVPRSKQKFTAEGAELTEVNPEILLLVSAFSTGLCGEFRTPFDS
jgi:hypothetical protein